MSSRPVVYLAFANDLDDHLAMLKKESRDILKALQPLEQAGQIQIHREESSAVDEIYQDLLTYDQDIVIFHYGGHADGSMLQLEGGRGQAAGLAQLLGQQKSLKLVFLNGCATKDQVQLLHRAGVPAVIANAVKINDEKATVFSTAFYQSLAQGRSIEEAFESARSLIETKYSGNDVFDISFNRFPVWDDDEDDDVAEPEHEGLEWSLYTRAEVGKDLEGWRLDAAASSWQVQLRDFDGIARSAVDDSPLQLNYRASQRRLPAMQCDRCGSVLILPADRDSDACRVCRSEEFSSTEVDTKLPDQVVEFVIPAVKAEALALATYEGLLTQGKASAELAVRAPQQVWMPYWQFDGDVEAEYAGEAAFPDGIADAAPKLKWQSSKDTISTTLEGAGVSACHSPLERSLRPGSSGFEQTRSFTTADLESSSLVADVSLQDAFETATSDLVKLVGEQVTELLGGVSQRDVSVKFKYDRVTARLLWVPTWLVAGTFKEQNYLLVIDGQTGDIGLPNLPGLQAISDAEKQAMKLKSLGSLGESEKATRWASLYGGVGLGIMVGLLLGLAAPSTKSIVGIFVGAVGVALAALLGLNDRHFSVAKGIRIGSFGLAVAFSALSGIYIRDHGLLTPNTLVTITENGDSGITRTSVKPSVAHSKRPTTYVDDEGRTVVVTTVSNGASYLFSQGVDLEVCSELQNAWEAERSAADILGNFEQAGDANWKTAVEVVRERIWEDEHKKAVLFALRDAICGYEEFSQPASIGQQYCGAVGNALYNYDDSVINPVLVKNNLSAFMIRIENSAPGESELTAKALLTTMLCARK